MPSLLVCLHYDSGSAGKGLTRPRLHPRPGLQPPPGNYAVFLGHVEASSGATLTAAGRSSCWVEIKLITAPPKHGYLPSLQKKKADVSKRQYRSGCKTRSEGGRFGTNVCVSSGPHKRARSKRKCDVLYAIVADFYEKTRKFSCP